MPYPPPLYLLQYMMHLQTSRMGGQFDPLQELAYNIHFFYIQEIFDFADIFLSHENNSKFSFESLRNEKISGQIAEHSSRLTY
jgi:hypothetical protein